MAGLQIKFTVENGGPMWTAAYLYEQEPGEPFDSFRLGVYVQR